MPGLTTYHEMIMTRRRWLASLASFAAPASGQRFRSPATRHSPVYHRFDPAAPLSVGNGEFAFTADATGLQTFPALYAATVPLCTQSQWGWHSFPLSSGIKAESFRLTEYETHGRKVGYPTKPDGQRALFDWLRENPHRLHLGRIGFGLRKSDDSEAAPADLAEIDQKLDLATGVLHSRFLLEGQGVAVETCCHPELDLISVRVFSTLAASGRLSIILEFPYGSKEVAAADWNAADHHTSAMKRTGATAFAIERALDDDHYFVRAAWEGNAAVTQPAPHRFVVQPASETLGFVCHFAAASETDTLPSVRATMSAAESHWTAFWRDGAALDLSASTDPRAEELERRCVLSQYLTAIQCAGTMPPQETGLTCNSWYGKFHLEMHWWHSAHFALWGRAPLLERSLAWYARVLPRAREWARTQGYQGARWPKMVGPEGRDSPSPIGPLLIWQQPHPIAMAELCYRARPDRATLDRHREIVFASAEFLASYAVLDRGRYVLGPPVIPAQENHPPAETWNPTYELEYWDHALGIAQLWRERLGLAPEPKWNEVREKLSALPVRDGVYLAHENCPQTFTERNRDHPSMLAAMGVLPGIKADRETMARTYRKVLEVWKWPDTWGWDYPMMAMTAARLGEPETAIEALLMDTPKNTWQSNGHNFQRANLPLYLPSNGGLLLALGMMAGGAPPAFPRKGWSARWQGGARYW